MIIKAFSKTMSVLLASALCLSTLPMESFAQTAAVVDTAANNGMPTIVQAEEDPTALKNGDVNADGIIDTADAEAIPNVKLSDCPQADVNADGVLDQTDADMIASFVSGEISYFPVGAVYNADAGYITRGEWIHALSTGFGMKVEDESSMVEYFTDISGTEYEKDINLAANFGVFDILEEEFHPNEFVTRDFAAHTMNFCLGYPNDVTILFSDVDDVYYDGDAQIALTQGWFVMVEGQFRPSMYVTSAECELAYADMNTAVEASQIDEKHEDEMTLSSEVKEINDAENIDMNGTTFTITGTSVEVSEGDTISFPYADTVLVRLVTKVTSEDGVITVETDDAEDEMVQSADAEGYALVDYEGYEILAEGLTVETIDPPKPAEPKPGARYNLSGTGKLNKTFKIGGTFDIMGTPLTLQGTISNIRVPYSFDKNFLGKVNYFYLGVDADVNLEASIKASDSLAIDPASIFGGRSIPLLSIPVLGYSNFGANLVLSAQVSVSGLIRIQYAFSCGAAVEYKNGSGWRVIKSFKQTKFTAEASVEEKIGVKIEVNAKIGKKKIGEVYASAGEIGKIYMGGNVGSNLTCLDVKAYLYMEIGANLNILNLLKYKKTWTIYDIDNSPIKIAMHWENGDRVAKCTAGKPTAKAKSDKVSGKGGSVSGKKSGGYVKGTGYTTGYTKAASTGSGNASNGFKPVFYKSTTTFKELEPPTVISEDTVLKEDMTIGSDLEITNGAALDLNGHKLTVEGNVTMQGNGGILSHKNGQLNVNGGSAIIKGNVHQIGSQTKFVMTNKSDYVLIEGDYCRDSNYDSSNTMTAGTLEVRGNISGDSINSTDMHTVILSGTNDVSISSNYDRQMFNMLEIQNSDKRKITVDKYFLVSSSTVCDGKTVNFICNESGSNTSELRLGKLTVDKLNIKGDHTLRSLDFQGSTVEIDGNVAMFKDAQLTFNKANVHITGSIWGSYGVRLNGSTFTTENNLQCYGSFVINNKNDAVNVGGNLKLGGIGDVISDGVINVKGDVTFEGSVRLNGYNQFILSGENDVTIYLPVDRYYYDYYFNDLEIQNLDKRKVYIDGGFTVKGKTDCGEKPLNIVSRDGCIALGELTCSELNISGDVSINGEMKLKAQKANFDGNLNITDKTVDLNGVPVTVAKTLTVSNDINLRNAEVNCTDMSLTGGTLYVNGGKLNVSGDMTVSGGSINMASAKDLIDIKGDLNIPRTYGSDNITAGTIQLAGDLTSTDNGLHMKSDSKFVLNGEKDQLLRMDLMSTSTGVYHFANLEVKNAASRKIINQGIINCGNIYADADAINMTSTNGRLASGKLYTDINITGDVTKRGNEFNLNGHTLNIEGNLYQEHGTITPSTGKLLVSGDYMIVSDHDSAVFGTSDGILNMVNDGDYVLVGGSFVTKTKKDHSKNLTAGTMEIKGNFTQLGGGTAKAFPASGTHVVILSGDNTQKVTFESYPDSHFNILKIRKDASSYEFSPEECWNELVAETAPSETTEPETEAPTEPETEPGSEPSTSDPGSEDAPVGDANGDNVVDLKDVMVIRRFYAGGWDVKVNEKAADVNHDGTVDLKDALIIRRYYAGGWDIELK